MLQVVDAIISANNSATAMPNYFIGYPTSYMTSYQPWSLSTYMQTKNQPQNNEEWDGLERSTLIKLADDVLVGVSNDKVKITVVKSFI